MQVFACTRRADVPLRDVTIAQMGNGATECGWCYAPEVRRGFLGFWKSQLSWVLVQEKMVGFCLLAEARPVALVMGATRVGGRGRWKSQNRKNVYLSPYVEESLNSKVIKSFVPELRSRKCFLCFEIPMLYIYIYIYMNIICPFRISVSGYGTDGLNYYLPFPSISFPGF